MYSEILDLSINYEKCNSCGTCVRECVNGVLTRDENNRVVIAGDGASRCIHCAHCLMVCPSSALSLDGVNPDDCPAVRSGADFTSLLNTVKSRRSIRHFKDRNVDAETLSALLETLRYPPTGVNFRNLRFSVITDRAIMDAKRSELYSRYFAKFEKDPEKSAQCELWKNALAHGGDPVFRTAPHLILANYAENAPCGYADTVIALSYFELLANTLGLGTVWFGRLGFLFASMPELTDMFSIDAGYKFGYAMLFGIPDVLFRRTVEREQPAVTVLH